MAGYAKTILTIYRIFHSMQKNSEGWSRSNMPIMSQTDLKIRDRRAYLSQ